jgi:hypothetical protein
LLKAGSKRRKVDVGGIGAGYRDDLFLDQQMDSARRIMELEEKLKQAEEESQNNRAAA